MVGGIYLDECCVRSLFFLVGEFAWLFLGDQLQKPGFLPCIALFQRQAQIPVIHRNGTCSLLLQKKHRYIVVYGQLV